MWEQTCWKSFSTDHRWLVSTTVNETPAALWAIVELNLWVIVGSIPSLRPLITKTLRDHRYHRPRLDKTTRSKFTHRQGQPESGSLMYGRPWAPLLMRMMEKTVSSCESRAGYVWIGRSMSRNREWHIIDRVIPSLLCYFIGPLDAGYIWFAKVKLACMKSSLAKSKNRERMTWVWTDGWTVAQGLFLFLFPFPFHYSKRWAMYVFTHRRWLMKSAMMKINKWMKYKKEQSIEVVPDQASIANEAVSILIIKMARMHYSLPPQLNSAHIPTYPTYLPTLSTTHEPEHSLTHSYSTQSVARYPKIGWLDSSPASFPKNGR